MQIAWRMPSGQSGSDRNRSDVYLAAASQSSSFTVVAVNEVCGDRMHDGGQSWRGDVRDAVAAARCRLPL
jgi:hypothetical protein